MAINPEDYVEIMMLYATQSQAVDRGDGEGYAATFAPDGKVLTATFKASGSEELKAMARQSFAASGAEQLRHWPGNFKFTQVSEDELLAVYYSMVFITGEDLTPRGKRMSLNTDTLKKINGAWKVAQRNSVPDPRSRAATAPSS